MITLLNKIRIVICFIIISVSMFKNTYAITITEKQINNKIYYIKNSNIWEYDPVTTNNKQVTNKANISKYSFSNDGSIFTYVSNSRLYVYNLISKKEIFVDKVGSDKSSPIYNTFNNKLYYINTSQKAFAITKYLTSSVRHLWAFDLKTGKKIDITKEFNYEISSINISPDGKYVSFASTKDKAWNVYIMQVDKGTTTKIAEGMKSVWLDTNVIAIGTFDRINLYNITTLKLLNSIAIDARFYPSAFCFNNDGNIYYEESSDGPDIDISFLDLKNGKVTKIVHEGRSPQCVK